ncbi:MAG: nucleoside hydrolase-like domain-containing protein [Bacteroidales bacterium]
MKTRMTKFAWIPALFSVILMAMFPSCENQDKMSSEEDKPRVIVTSDGEIDDECSFVRFLLYTNEWDVEGIITSSSQYHWHGHNWAGDEWTAPYLNAYAEVYPSLVTHDGEYPTPEYLKSVTFLGNVETEGEMDSITPGSQHIVQVLLDTTDDRPVWIQAWGGTNTIARALKTIEEDHPEQMEYVAGKIRFYFIWEQDTTYQAYIRPHWGKYNIPTIIPDQFWAIAYQWNKVLPEDKQTYFKGDWMKAHILEDHGALCSLYRAHVAGSHGLSGDTDFNDGDFRSEGDSPSFLHVIPTGLRNMESPGYGGWGGRFVKVRSNTWLDPVPDSGYVYPEGRWYSGSAWGREYMRDTYPEDQDRMREYFKPMARWVDAFQNDFAARADWCVKSYSEANHPPVVELGHDEDIAAKQGETVPLSAEGTSDPDGDSLSYRWWQYSEADSYPGIIKINDAYEVLASVTLPGDAGIGETIYVICEVTDDGEPALTRYRRVIITVER